MTGPRMAPADIRSKSRPIFGEQLGAPGQPAMPDVAVQLPPAWQFPIPSAVDFFLSEPGTVIAAGAVAEPVTLQFALQTGYRGVIRGVTIFADAPTVAMFVIWTVKVNGGPVQGWDRLTTFPRAAANLSIAFDGVIRVAQTATISIAITNNSAAPFTLGASYTGWQWPEDDERRIYGRLW